MTRIAWIVSLAVPQKSVSTTRLACSSVVDSVSPISEYPALLTRTSMRPNLPRAAATAALIDDEEVTSRVTLRTFGPSGIEERLFSCLAVATRRWVGWPLTKRASDLPRPEEQPVTVQGEFELDSH